MKKYVLNLVLLLMLLSGCSDRMPHYNQELLQLESRVGAVPDSVYSRLDSFRIEEMSAADRALFIIIKTEAADKLYKVHTTDSLIAEARGFFEHSKDILRLAKACYLAGRIHSDWEEWTLAAEDFLQARKLTRHSSDWVLRGRIAFFVGDVNWMNRLYPEAQTYFREAYSCYEQALDTLKMVYTLRRIGETYMANYQTDSAILLYKQALVLAEFTQEPDAKVNIYQRLGYMYHEMGDYKQAMAYLRMGITCSETKSYALINNIGRLYLQLNRLDSARYYLEQALESPSLPTQCLANFHMGELLQKEGKLEEAYAYQKKYELLVDSLDNSKQTKDVIRLQHKQKEKELVEIHESQLRLKDYVIAGLAVFAVVAAGAAYRLRYRKIYYRREITKLTDCIRRNEAAIRLLKEQNECHSENGASETASKEQMEQENLYLLKKFGKLNMEQCRRNPYLKRLYGGKKDIVPVFGQTEWAQYDEAFLSVYPFFTASLKKSFPHLSEQEVRICQLSVMGVKTSKVADVLLLQSDTVSSYKQKIKKACFPNAFGTLEELLLPFIVG